MKNLIITVAFFISIQAVASVQFVNKYQKERGIFKTLTIPMAFDTDSILRRLPKINSDLIYRIDYVATTYSRKITPYQKHLNQKRWETMCATIKIDKDKTYNKKEFYQIGAKSKEEASQYFHGYIIYFGIDPVKAHSIGQIQTESLIEKIVGKPVNDYTTCKVEKSSKIDSVFVGTISVTQKKSYDAKLIRKNHVIEWGYDSIGVDKKYHNAYYILTQVTSGIFTAYCALKDRSVFDMLQRSKLNENTIIATDLTGSMSPYYSQILVWHALKLSQGKKYNHVFFNDGNNKKTKQKAIGNTGGVYMTSTLDIINVYKTMNKCLKGGNGGDCPENNLEAVQKGLKKWPNANQIIMLADNYAFPRDVVLIHDIKMPINYVMCGTKLGINKRYVNLAKHYGGTLTTVEKTIENMQEIKEKGRLKVGEDVYKCVNGKVVKVN